MDLIRTPLLDQSPVPVDWPTRVGPAPGITRMVAYPAGGPPDPENPKPSVDAIYPRSLRKIAKAHAWMFPGKRIKITASVDLDLKRALIEGLARERGVRPRPPHAYPSYLPDQSDSFDHNDPLLGRHAFSDEGHRNAFLKSVKQNYTAVERPSSGGVHVALVTRRRPPTHREAERRALFKTSVGDRRELNR